MVALGTAFVCALLNVYAAQSRSDGPVRIVAFGDSLFAGFGLAEAEDAFPARLQNALVSRGYHVVVLPGGVSGDTTRGGLARVDWTLGARPDGAIVALGANDMLRGLEPSAMRANLSDIVERFERAGVDVLLVGLPPLGNWGGDMQKAYASAFREVAEQQGVPLHPNLLAGVAGKPRLNQPDGIHPNRQGVDVMVEAILPAAVALVKEVLDGRKTDRDSAADATDLEARL